MIDQADLKAMSDGIAKVSGAVDADVALAVAVNLTSGQAGICLTRPGSDRPVDTEVAAVLALVHRLIGLGFCPTDLANLIADYIVEAFPICTTHTPPEELN